MSEEPLQPARGRATDPHPIAEGDVGGLRLRRLRRFLRQARPRYTLAYALLAAIPPEVGLRLRLRSRVYRAVGFAGIDPTR
ncbi:MAG: hypothetical protein ACREOV_05265 [Candidatus Dormibacteraceae bacterium]